MVACAVFHAQIFIQTYATTSPCFSFCGGYHAAQIVPCGQGMRTRADLAPSRHGRTVSGAVCVRVAL